MYEFKIAASLKRISRLSESRKIIEKVLAEIDKDMKKADEHEKRALEYRDQFQEFELARRWQRVWLDHLMSVFTGCVSLESRMKKFHWGSEEDLVLRQILTRSGGKSV
eukprot:Protomagalhaensia_sp_Gyna_25__268@NODE_1127_length_2162_cov_107_679228_g895_i0_p2_GENE_NODE_1127_length_2162_cov_107_679228_g895_i0NODE_1127_length_2162_cov_107_679228_g895_i0_p2_ORF_typecomplete_len108_score31_91DUF1140/PF06600_11/0_019Baculo_helicase/PF04735_12/0_044DUF4315/PF14193_6/0_21_NODE_1127_length_2162_cov_107_679228_g895_i09851308